MMHFLNCGQLTHTLPMLFKPTEAKLLAGLLLATPYAMTALMALTRQLPPAILAAWLTLPLGVRWFRGIWIGPVEEKHVVGMALLHAAFGLLFAAGMAWTP